MPSHQLLTSPHRRPGPSVVSSSTVPSIESIYSLVGKPAPSPPSTYSPADITAKRKEEVRRKLERDEEGLGTGSAFSSGNLDAYGQGIISGHSSGINIKARAKAFEEGRSSPRVERSPELKQKQQHQSSSSSSSSSELKMQNYSAEGSSNVPSIGILPGGGNSDYSAVYTGTPSSQKRHYNQYEEAGVNLRASTSREKEDEEILEPNYNTNSSSSSSIGVDNYMKDETSPKSPATAVTPSRISASKRAEDARKEYVRELEAQASEQRRRKEAEKAYRLSPGWTLPHQNSSPSTSLNAYAQSIASPSQGGIAELLGSSSGYFSVDSRSPSLGSASKKQSPNHHQHQQFMSPSSSSSLNSSPRPFLRLDPLPDAGGGEASTANGPWTPRSPQRQSSSINDGVHSYSPKWMAQRAAELEADSALNSGGGALKGGSTNLSVIKSPGGMSASTTTTTKDRLLREQVNRLTEKFDITLDALQQYAERFGPLD